MLPYNEIVVLSWLALLPGAMKNISLVMKKESFYLECSPRATPSSWERQSKTGVYVCYMATYIDLSDGNVNHATHNN